jgi:hypothetical protein
MKYIVEETQQWVYMVMAIMMFFKPINHIQRSSSLRNWEPCSLWSHWIYNIANHGRWALSLFSAAKKHVTDQRSYWLFCEC